MFKDKTFLVVEIFAIFIFAAATVMIYYVRFVKDDVPVEGLIEQSAQNPAGNSGKTSEKPQHSAKIKALMTIPLRELPDGHVIKFKYGLIR